MKEVIIKKYEEENNGYQSITIDEIKEKLNELDISDINLQGKIIDSHDIENKISCMKLGYRDDDDITITAIYTDENHPIVIKKDEIFGNKLLINPEWYIKNKDKVTELICYIAKNIERKELNINNTQLINDKLIESLSGNQMLETVSLAKYDKENPYNLSKKHYDMLKKTTIKTIETSGVEKELEENFDPLIGCNYKKELIQSYYNYEELNNEKSTRINIVRQLTKEELKNFKYINPNKIIRFNENSYLCINEAIERLKELELPNKVVISIEDKEKFNHFLLNNRINRENIYIYSDFMEVPLKEYLKFEKKLYEMIEEAKNLSPFEKYIYAYNKVKKFKDYKENEEDLTEARNLYKILENKYMVCVGFANLFGDLLKKLGLPNKRLNVSVDTSYDKSIKGEEEVEGLEKPVTKDGHARSYTYIKDEKYGIDGFYISDPTWDNDLEKDFYNHLALTNKEAAETSRYIWINKNDTSELLNVQSIEEFYQKIEFLIGREKGLYKDLKSIIKDLITNQLLPLDKSFVAMIKNKYSFIDSYRWPEDISSLIYELGEYIVNHVNKEIPGQTIIEAVTSIYRTIYGYSEEELQTIIPKIIEENKKRQSRTFPQRTYTDSSGEIVKITNEKNKFDITSEEAKER